MCFICRLNVYFSRNQRKFSQNGEDGNLKSKFMRQMIYYLVGCELLNKTVYLVCHFNVYFSRKWQKCSQNSEKQKLIGVQTSNYRRITKVTRNACAGNSRWIINNALQKYVHYCTLYIQ